MVKLAFLIGMKGKDGLPKIVESEAKTVRLIYKLFLEGKTPSGIAKHLTESVILTPAGKRKWQVSTVESILTNEKYKGDAVLQKTFTVDFLTKKKKVNEGEIPQYYVENSHPAIIESDVFYMVQFEMKRRKESGRCHSGATCFSSTIVCGECGNFYGSKVWHSTSKYRRTIWQCNHKFKKVSRCKTPHIDEANLMQLFLNAFNQLITNKEEIKENCEMIKKALTDTAALDAEAEETQQEVAVITEMIRQCVDDNAHIGLDQAEYKQRYNGLVARYEKAKSRLEKTEEICHARKVKREQLDAFIDTMMLQDSILTEFDEGLWYAVIEKVTVDASGGIMFTYRDGTVVKA